MTDSKHSGDEGKGVEFDTFKGDEGGDKLSRPFDEAALDSLVRDIMQVPYSKHKAKAAIRTYTATATREARVKALKQAIHLTPVLVIPNNANDRYAQGINVGIKGCREAIKEEITKLEAELLAEEEHV